MSCMRSNETRTIPWSFQELASKMNTTQVNTIRVQAQGAILDKQMKIVDVHNMKLTNITYCNHFTRVRYAALCF